MYEPSSITLFRQRMHAWHRGRLHTNKQASHPQPWQSPVQSSRPSGADAAKVRVLPAALNKSVEAFGNRETRSKPRRRAAPRRRRKRRFLRDSAEKETLVLPEGMDCLGHAADIARTKLVASLGPHRRVAQQRSRRGRSLS